MCKRSWLILVCTLAVLVITDSLVLAQLESDLSSPHIYKIKIAGCSSEPTQRRQTGFRVQDKKGIVTALHGVVGCTTINAEPGVSEAKSLNNLVIAEVDIDRDMALLRSKELDVLPVAGFGTIVDPKNGDYRGVHVIGYPLGLPVQTPTTQITVTQTTELSKLIPDELVVPLANRGSPALWIKVLRVEGHLLPGHSGAPLLNNSDQVIGVANGGLDLGRAGITWAIPWYAIEWKPMDDDERLRGLEEGKNNSLFDYFIPEEVGEPPTTPVVITVGDYVQISATKGVNLREPPGTNSPIIVGAGQYSILEVIEGPQNEERVEWWRVRKIGGAQIGWIASSDNGDILIQSIPKIGKNFRVLVSLSQGLQRYKSASINGERMDVLKRGDELQVIEGPNENGGFLWVRLSKGSSDIQGGWVIFAGNRGVNLEAVPNSIEISPTLVPTQPVTPTPSDTVPTQTVLSVTLPTDASSNLPLYTCAADAFVTYLTPQQIQMMEFTVKYGFRLRVIPLVIEDQNMFSEDQRATAIKNGEWDCLITTMESMLIHGDYGAITAFNDESTGAEQIWVQQGIDSIDDLKGLRIAHPEGGSLTMDFLLSLAGLSPNINNTTLPSLQSTACNPIGQVIPVPANTLADAIDLYNNGAAEAVSGWTPDIEKATQRGGHLLVSDKSVRVSISVIITSRKTIQQKPDLVQAFHNAWFDALKSQFENPRQAAEAIAQWGHNDWTGISKENSFNDFVAYMEQAAQVTLNVNHYMMTNPGIIEDLLKYQQRVLINAGRKVASVDFSTVTEPKFVLAAWEEASLHTKALPLNPTFHLGLPTEIPPALGELQTITDLPFKFDADSTSLSEEVQDKLTNCIAPIIKLFGTGDLVIQILGSAAWPPDYSEKEIYHFALRRAQAVESFLITQGINPIQLRTEARVPTEPCPAAEGCPQDRYVKLTLLTTGGK